MDSVIDELLVFSGNAHPQLARDVCQYLDIPLGQAEMFKFANDNTFVRILENVRQRDVFIIQPICYPVNDNLMELLIAIDAFKRASAGRITAVVPYYGYGRTDKKDQPRVPITARLVADLLTAAGANRLLTVDLHAGQIQGFFNIPVDELTALPILIDYFKAKEIPDLAVVAVDIGISKRARDVAEHLDVPLAIIEKRRVGNEDLVKQGVTQVFCCATHPIFTKEAPQRLAQSSFQEVVVTDTVPLTKKQINGKITVLSVAPLLGEAIYRIHKGQSVGELFK